MPFDAILFDKDGTLVDFDRTWCPAASRVMKQFAGGDGALLARLADVSRFDLDRLRFEPDSPLLAGTSRAFGPLWAQALGRVDIAVLCREIDERFRLAGLETLSPIGRPADLSAHLVSRGLKLGIASNDALASVRLQAERLGMAGHMSFLAGHDSGFGSKPGPGMVVAFASHLQINPARLALVGDSMQDVEAAHAAGATAVAVLTGPAHHEDLAQHADYVIDDVHDLPMLLDRLRLAA